MRYFLLMVAGVAFVGGCASTPEPTKGDLEKVFALYLGGKQLTDVKGVEKLTKITFLQLNNNQLTDVKGLVKLTQLRVLHLRNNPDLTKAQIDELQKALPKYKIYINPTK
jgi:Leucine-rich repeat (LRR) protein